MTTPYTIIIYFIKLVFSFTLFYAFPLSSNPISSSSSSMLTSQGVVLATAMAVSGTVILLALRLQKSPPIVQIPQQSLRPCISPEGKKNKKKKRVQFAEDVVEPRGNSGSDTSSSIKFKKTSYGGAKAKDRGTMPENRVALYNGILRDRVVHRFSYSCY
ncbi:uncharacterized protein LOC119993605 [Tripterygium wilfordii]|uniref:uncharacterized protein LOC119993605 n=1 Tax=Tripterygium wilfordii TaxID=458696 RepID=UPI0018F7F18E|nr:uncharacterized protein LOC119993605 [Tripterygium wilfordii]